MVVLITPYRELRRFPADCQCNLQLAKKQWGFFFPLSDQELLAKYMANGKANLKKENMERIAEAIWSLEEQEN